MPRATRRLRLEALEKRQMMTTFALDLGAIDLSGGVLAPPDDPPPGNIPTAYGLSLNSLPGAPVSLYLDFNGHYQDENVGGWDVPIVGGHIGGWSNFSLPAYDRDGDPFTFSPQEQEDIRLIWATVAEDFAPFNINVTTVDPDPGYFPENNGPYLRVVISGGGDIRDGKNAGGFAAEGAYTDGDEPNVAFVFLTDKNIPAGQQGHHRDVEFLAGAASHEAGHAFGLDHYDAGTGDADKAPIMESDGAWPSKRGTWWGDDMNQLASVLGYRADHHGNTIQGAAGMYSTNIGLRATGIIETVSDVDTFRFTTGGGNVSIWVDEAMQDFHSVGNLDAVLRLLDASGNVIAENNDPDLIWASIETTLAAGTYFVQVASNGEAGDVGQYTLKVFENTGPRIIGSKYFAGTSGQGSVLVTFDEPINPLTFTIYDVRINGGAAGVNVQSIMPADTSGKAFMIHINVPWTLNGTVGVAIGPNISDLFGSGMDQNQNGMGGSQDPLDYYYASFWATGVYDRFAARSTSLSPQRVDAYFGRL